MILQATVMGIPRPQGSKRHVGGGRIIDANADVLLPWREAVAASVARAIPPGWDTEGAYTLTAVFTWPRLKTRDDKYKASPPDLDKLLRAVMDACTSAGAFRDDGRVVEAHALKMYSELAGLRLRIEHKEQSSEQ